MPRHPVDKTLIVEFLGALDADVAKAKADLAADPHSQTRRRAFVRAVFANFEGTTYIFKQAALHGHEARNRPLSHGERHLLEEEVWQITNGEAKLSRKPMHPYLPNNFRFAMNMFVRSWGPSDFALNEAQQRWDEFSRAQTIRNRLTHPKSSGDLNVTDEDLALVGNVWNWFQQVVTSNQSG